MRNVQALMKDGVDTPKGYLGHTGSVTVVTHNVVTTGARPSTWAGPTRATATWPACSAPPAASTSPATSGATRWRRCSRRPATRTCPTTSTTPARCSPSAPRGTPRGASAVPGRRTPRRSRSAARRAPSRGATLRRPPAHRAPTGSNVPSYFSADCGSRWVVARDTALRHPPVPGAALPRHRQPLRRRQRPGTPGRGHLGHRRRPRDHGAGGRRLERHLRQPPRRRQGRAHVGRRQRPGGRDAGLRPDDAHGVRHRDRRRPGRPDHAGARGQWRARRHARRPHRRPRLGRG